MFNKKIFPLSILLSALVLSASPTWSDVGQSLAHVSSGDNAYAQRLDPAQAKVALQSYEKAIEADPNNVEALWKAARAIWWIGDTSKTKKEKLTSFKKGIELAKKGIELNKESVESRFWLGANYGSYGDTKGVLKSLFLIKPIKKEMEEIIRLYPEFDDGAAYRVLAIIEYKVPRLFGGSLEKAQEYFDKTLALNERNPFTAYYLAEFNHVKRDSNKASQYLDLLDSLTDFDGDAADIDLMKKKGQKLRKKI